MDADRAMVIELRRIARIAAAAVGAWLVTWPAPKLQRAGLFIAAFAAATCLTRPHGEPQQIPEMFFASGVAATLLWVGRPPRGIAVQFLATAIVAFGAYLLAQVTQRRVWIGDPFGFFIGWIILGLGLWMFVTRPSLTVAQILGTPAILAAVVLFWFEMMYSDHQGTLVTSNAVTALAVFLFWLGVHLCRLQAGPLARRTSPF